MSQSTQLHRQAAPLHHCSPGRPAGDVRYGFEVPARAESVALARKLTQQQLDSWQIAGEVCDYATLVISELVTNAVVHTASELIVCELRDVTDRLCLAVKDEGHGAGSPAVRRVAEEEQGRGLLLVTAVSSSWGIDDARPGPGLVVWAELPHAGDPDR